jgi:ABC-type lipoprotein release transport system permease subunit
MFGTLYADVRYAMRSLAGAPVWTIALVLTIAIGTGSAAAVQGFVNGLLRTDLPMPGRDTAVSLFRTDGSGAAGPMPFADVMALGDRRDVFELLGAVAESQERIVLASRTTLQPVASITPDVAAVMALPIVDGAVLSHRLRFSEFDARANTIDEPLSVGAVRTHVGGIAPYWLEGLFRGRPIDVWLTLPPDRMPAADVWAVGRLKPGVSIATAQAAIDRARPGQPPIVVVPYNGLMPEAAAAVRRIEFILRVAAAAVLAVACANVAAFLLVRGSARSRETAVRVAIGARQRQIARQLLVDSAVVSLVGGVAGLLMARWMADIVPLLFFDQDAGRLVFTADVPGILWTSLVCGLLTIACGLAPLLEARRIAPASVLQRESAGPSRLATRLNTALILVQMTACTVLVMTGGLLLESFRAARLTHAGGRLDGAILASVEATPRRARGETSAAGLEYFAAIERAARDVVPVTAATWVARLPGAQASWQWVRFDKAAAADREISVYVEPFTADVLESVVLPPSAGRLLGDVDRRTCGGVLLSAGAAEDLFDGEAPGRALATPAGRVVEVVGVVRSKEGSDHRLFTYPFQSPPLAAAGPSKFRAPARGELPSGLLDVNIVGANYFEVTGMTVVDGTAFGAHPDACRTGVVNEEAAARFFDGHPIGSAIIDASGLRTWITGVVRSEAWRSEQRRIEPMLYVPMTQDFLPRMTSILIPEAASDALVQPLLARLKGVPGGREDRLTVTTLHEHLNQTSLAADRIAAVLIAAFAAIALVLGALGLYGLLADAARRRGREFALRLALGAQAWRVVRQVMLEGSRLVMAGAALGLLISVGVAQWIGRITPAAGWPSWTVWVSAPLSLAAAVIAASIIPARKALSVDLLTIMRDS